VRRPTGDVAEMGAIPPSEEELAKLEAKENLSKNAGADNAGIDAGRTRAGMTGAE